MLLPEYDDNHQMIQLRKNKELVASEKPQRIMMFSAEIRYVSWIAEAGYRWVAGVDDGGRRDWDDSGQDNIPAGGLKDLKVERYLHDRTLLKDRTHAHPRKRGVLTEAFTVSDRKEVRRYRSFEPFKDNPTLYRNFASIPWMDYSAAIEFAKQYGMLETQRLLNIPAFSLPEGVYVRGRKHCIPADPEEDWFVGSAMLRALIRVWENLENETVLKELFHWEREIPAYSGQERPYTWHWHPHQDDGPPYKEDGELGLDVCDVLREWDYADYQEEDDQRLIDRIIPSRRWVGTEPLKDVAVAFIRQELSIRLSDLGRCSIRVSPPSEGPMSIQVVPSNMLEAMFLQFAQAHQGNKDHRQCKVCGKWFELMPKDRGKREFCGDNCKFKDYRMRKQKAIEMKSQHKSLTQIEKETGTPFTTLIKWFPKKGG